MLTTQSSTSEVHQHAARDALASVSSNVSVSATAAAIRVLRAKKRKDAQQRWLAALARFATELRPDLAPQMLDYIGEDAWPSNVLRGLTIGELGVVYEALLAESDHAARKQSGQYFTPDDVAQFLAQFSSEFDQGVWMDPCCGIGNLSWHLASLQGENAADLVKNRLVLVDRDPIARKSAVVLLTVAFAMEDDVDVLRLLDSRSRTVDFLLETSLPHFDFAILNPPYAPADAYSGYTTSTTRDLYALFLERVMRLGRGFIAITPASYLTGRKYAPLRELLSKAVGGKVFVLDNVPDTCFRGFKYGSTNSSKTNFVRAAVTVSNGTTEGWTVTPILRWTARSRARMFAGAHTFLRPRQLTPDGTWAKLMPGSEGLWSRMMLHEESIADLVSASPTPWKLDIASTPRYYISASSLSLNRGSKHTLHFKDEDSFRRAYLVLNSSLAYWWWRSVDGGITLSKRTLLSLPVPAMTETMNEALLDELRRSDRTDLVEKLNAGRLNENVRRPAELRNRLDELILGGTPSWLDSVYSPDMFRDYGEVNDD